MSKGGGAQIAGFKYFFGIHMGVCRGPVDQLVEIKVSDRQAWPIPVATGPAADLGPTGQDYDPHMVTSYLGFVVDVVDGGPGGGGDAGEGGSGGSTGDGTGVGSAASGGDGI